MLGLLLMVFWLLFGGYSVWFFTKAKMLQPLTLDELVILWKLHRQQTGCHASLSKLEPVIVPHSREFVGFKCDCGYQYLSKRLITQREVRMVNMFQYLPVKTKDDKGMRLVMAHRGA